MQKKKVEIIGFLIVFCLLITACSANNGNGLVESIPSHVEVNVSAEESTPNNSSQQLINVNKSSDVITPDTVYIAKITPSEAICIAKVVISDNTSYTIKLSEESGGALFTALNKTDDVISSNGVKWLHMSIKESFGENPFSSTIPLPLSNLIDEDDLLTEGVYYLYVGSMGDELTDVNISIVGSGSGAEVELIK